MSESEFATPEQAEEAFYDAFARNDLDAMMRVWAAQPDIVCIQPMGTRAVGAEVEDSWRTSFGHGEPVAVHRTDLRMRTGEELAVHTLEARILFGDRRRTPLRILTTNVYRRTGRGWRMVVHHASPAPELTDSSPAGSGSDSVH